MMNGPEECVSVCRSRLPWRLASGTLRGRGGGEVCCWGKACHWSVHVGEAVEWGVYKRKMRRRRQQKGGGRGLGALCSSCLGLSAPLPVTGLCVCVGQRLQRPLLAALASACWDVPQGSWFVRDPPDASSQAYTETPDGHHQGCCHCPGVL